MASLKEIKGRINSIRGTLKITSAMKMVASAKLHKAQGAMGNMLPYEAKLHEILTSLLSSGTMVHTPFAVQQEVKRVAIVVCASNSSLCGGYNANVIRHLNALLQEYSASVGKDNILVYPIGKKVAEAVQKEGFKPMGDFQHLSGVANYQGAVELVAELTDKFIRGEVQQVELLYNHFKSTASQEMTRETFLPLDLNALSGDCESAQQMDYIVEPSAGYVVHSLLPKVLKVKLYTVLLDAAAAEHAARTMAMQIASDNANDLIQELTLMYNKSRQQAITNELLDIVGGTMA